MEERGADSSHFPPIASHACHLVGQPAIEGDHIGVSYGQEFARPRHDFIP